ncbi:tRNA (guanine(37)-n1)-methyltransferase [Anaeramoeba flamelloides]|uniref:tRNA (guanine(37)-N1)-methyltransferase n=1 Tax=Anaeramoeba flamelloides TaxID=1746091 RepID=A0AAV7Z3T0_9EUKA|nr:tRNA (guanine(37)-n1)-methyltransferase [Anaeramoeba flamelloides]
MSVEKEKEKEKEIEIEQEQEKEKEKEQEKKIEIEQEQENEKEKEKEKEINQEIEFDQTDPELITKTIKLVAIQVPAQKCHLVMSKLRKNVLKRAKNKSVIDSQKKGYKLVLLKETITNKNTLEGLPERTIKFIKSLEDHEILIHELLVGYNELSPREILTEILPENCDVPSSFETVGTIAHINLHKEQLPYKYIIGKVLFDKNKHIKTVVNKIETISNEFRVFPMEVLHGDPNLETIVNSDKIKFKLDFSKVYWNSRLGHEHSLLVELFQKQDLICDMFCGIGPFVIRAAKKGCTVNANDKNPVSIKYLKENCKINKVNQFVSIYNLDAREFILKIFQTWKQNMQLLSAHKKIHFVMNLPKISITFLDVFKKAFSLISFQSDPEIQFWVHCYFFINVDQQESETQKGVEKYLDSKIEIFDIKFVRSVSPSKDMVRISFLIPHQLIIQKGKHRKLSNN